MNDFEGEGEGEGEGELEIEGENEGEEEIVQNQNEENVILVGNNEGNERQVVNEGDMEEGVEIENFEDGHGEEKIEHKEKSMKNSKVISNNNENIIKKSNEYGDESNLASKSIETKEMITKKNINGVETIVEKKEITRFSNKNQGLPEEKKEITIITQSKIEPETKN